MTINKSNHEVDKLLDNIQISFDKSKDEVWNESFKEIIESDTSKKESKTYNIFNFNSKLIVGMAASLICGLLIYNNIVDNEIKNPVQDNNIEFSDSAIVESLFIEDSELDDYLNSYVINELVND
tara:strand:+ start:577 stop:948 length:372 start_codon:yes stop_codon:yes gene_type:complete